MNGPTPDKVMQLITGAWAASILGAAARHGLFTALEGNPDNTDGVAKKTGISSRGAQARLDGLTGLGLLTLSEWEISELAGGVGLLDQGQTELYGCPR